LNPIFPCKKIIIKKFLGKVNIVFTILPDTFSISNNEKLFTGSGSDDFTPDGQYAQEVWTKTDQMYPGFNFSEYNLL